MKRGNHFLLTFFLLFILLCACQKQQNQKWKQDRASTNAQIYMDHCANCHGEDLQGGYGPSIVKIGLKYKEIELLTIIQKGKGKMPAQSYISKVEKEKLAHWLATKK